MEYRSKAKERERFINKLKLVYWEIRICKGRRIITVRTEENWKVYDAELQKCVIESPNIWRILHIMEGTKNHIVMYNDENGVLLGYYVSEQKVINLSKAADAKRLSYLQLEDGPSGILSATTSGGSRVALDMKLNYISPPSVGISTLYDGTVLCFNSPRSTELYRNKTLVGYIPDGYTVSLKTLYKNYPVIVAASKHGEILYNRNLQLLYKNTPKHNSELIVHNRLALLIDETVGTREIYSQKHRKFIPDTSWFDGIIRDEYLATFMALGFKDRYIWVIPEEKKKTIGYIGDFDKLILGQFIKPDCIDKVKNSMGIR